MAIDNATYSSTSGGALKVSPPAFTNLTWILDTVEVSSEGEWEITKNCDDADWTFANGALMLTGDVRIAAGQKLPAKGGYLTDADSKHWRIEASKITELYDCKPCRGSLTLEWSQAFHDAVEAGDYTIDPMSSPPLSDAFVAAT